MKPTIFIITSFILLLTLGTAHGQERAWADIDKSGYYKEQTITQGKFTLVFIDKYAPFSQTTRQRLIDLFFKVYPQEVARFNSHSSRKVTFVIDTAYHGVAATLDDVVKFDPRWLAKNPEDIDAATHELMHVVQSYKGENPGWLVEGIADYARQQFGINNTKSGWQLPAYRQGQNYTDAYRVTARFLLWIEKNYNAKLVIKLNEAMRKNKYDDNSWVKLTGKSLDELWYLYTTNPSLTTLS